MTLYDIVTTLINIAKKQPNINYAENGDIYTLNSIPNINYSVFYITQNNHTQREDTVNYNLTLFYIDRVNSSGNNVLQIQSTGMLALNNILNNFNNLYDVEVGDIDFTTFVHRFQDDCAGVYANVTITADAELGLCGF
jgi:hypothetical protein